MCDGETDFSVAFSNLGAMESPSERSGMASRSISKPGFEAGSGFLPSAVRGISLLRPDFSSRAGLSAELPEKM